ncbi:MAG: ABC transporter substrate-binding protein, partial [Candidatus Thermoplasmatota archaeon]|nr:ABC transporter substrate-binding protein [Candidatus Thermoplasmatota archaeon]
MMPDSPTSSKLRLVSFIVVAIVAMSVIAVSHYGQEERLEPVKVGVVLPLTGPASFLVDIRDGMLLAVDEVNDDGGIDGRPLKLIVKDSESSPEAGLAAFERIEAKHKPAMYFSATSSVSNAIAPRAEELGVPLMGLVVSMTGFTEGREWV